MRAYLKLPELKALMDATRHPRDRLIIRMMYQTGLRVGELAALKIADIDFELGELSIRQAKWHPEGRKVPLVDEFTLALLSEYIGMRMSEPEAPLFLSSRRGPISRRALEHMVERCGIRAGLEAGKAHPHALRHTHAVYALKSGIDLRTLQQNLGHSTIATTALYLGLDIDDRKEIYAAHPLPLTELDKPLVVDKDVGIEDDDVDVTKDLPDPPHHDESRFEASFELSS